MAQPSLDLRLLRLGVEINGKLQTFTDLYISAQGSKYANDLQNECSIKILNLNKYTREHLLTLCTPYNLIKTPKRIVLDAGRESTGYFRLFSGDIVRADPSQPPDIAINIHAITNNFDKTTIVTRSSGPQVALSKIAAQVARDLKLILVFQATDKQIANYSFTGAVINQVKKLNNAGGVSAYVDDGKLIVKNTNVALRGVSYILSISSGMVGVPEPTEFGVKAKMFAVPGVQLGGQLTVKSQLNPLLNGSFNIFKLDFDVTNRDTPFYYIAEAARDGIVW